MAMHASTSAGGTTARLDLIWVGAGALLLWVASAMLELSERLIAALRPWERFQLDELPGVLLFLALALAWYAWRRVSETREQLQLRRVAEARLAETLAENRRLSLSHVDVQEAERRQLARELHDELGQHLNAIKIDAVLLRDWSADQPADIQRAAHAVIEGADRVHDTLRGLLRRLRPVGLDELGLSAALEHLVDNWRARNASTPVALRIDAAVDDLAENQNITCYRLIQEALNNVTRHARASQVTILLARAGEQAHRDRITLSVSDNGVGMAAQATAPGLGLVGMRERIEALGGQCVVESPAGQGFTIRASFPVNNPE